MGTIQQGAEQAIVNCARVQPGESVVIITDHATQHIASQLRDVAEGISPGNITTFIMEDFGPRPDDGSTPLPLPDEIVEALGGADVSFFAATSKKGEVQTFRLPLIKVVLASDRLRHGHMPGITDELMRTGMCADYGEVQKVSAKVGEIVRDARYITVTTPAGTEFTAEFSPSYRWIVLDGTLRPGTLSNLPEGEVATCPYNVEGVVVVDGILGDYFTEEFGPLENTPVTLEIQDGRVREISCDNNELLRELQDYTRQDENANRIGEFAIGTNTGLDRLVGNMLQDEKFPGVHIAMGDPTSELTGADWQSKTHIDALLMDVTIDVDGQIIMREGKFTI